MPAATACHGPLRRQTTARRRNRSGRPACLTCVMTRDVRRDRILTRDPRAPLMAGPFPAIGSRFLVSDTRRTGGNTMASVHETIEVNRSARSGGRA